MRENRENEIARAHEQNLILRRARDVYLCLSISRVYRQRRINSSVEAALYVTVDRGDKFSLSRKKEKGITHRESCSARKKEKNQTIVIHIENEILEIDRSLCISFETVLFLTGQCHSRRGKIYFYEFPVSRINLSFS